MEKAVVRRAAEAARSEQDWGELHWFASGALGNSQRMTLGKCVLRPGRRNPTHLHPDCEEILHVLSGRIRHYVEGQEEVEMGPGDTITIPPGLRHHARNTGGEEAVLLVVFSSPERRVEGE